MHFFINLKEQTIYAALKKSTVAKEGLQQLGFEVLPGEDPIYKAHQHFGENGRILNLTAAFEFIENSDDGAAQELAGQLKEAVNDVYKR